jgi:retron-type reverse transcriptase
MALIHYENDIRECGTVFSLAKLLNLEVKTLLFFAYNNDKLYSHYKIKKKTGGERNISAPIEALKTTCAKINFYLNEIYSEYLPQASHGFVPQRSIITNAKKHLSKRYILNIDIEDFFGTINTGRVIGLFKGYPFLFNKAQASILAGLVTHNNALPQGSPCSPVISNMICFRLDKELTVLAQSKGWIYSRYADDITISSNKLTDDLATKVGPGVNPGKIIVKILNQNGFVINKKKTRLSSPLQSKWVTGIKVNEGLNVSRKLIRQVRAMLNAWEKYDYKQAQIHYNKLYSVKEKNFSAVVRGKIDYIGNIKSKNNITYIKLYNRLCNLENKYHNKIPESFKDRCVRDVLVIKSEKGFGSGFFINKNFIVTAAHLLTDGEKSVHITTKERKLPVEFKSASVIYVNKEQDFAILGTYSKFPNSIFEADFRKRDLDINTDYLSVGYGGFRSNETFWTDPCIVDQKILQLQGNGAQIEFVVGNPMWSGMSGGPVINQKTKLVVGYIVNGAETIQNGREIKSHIFRPISNIPEEYRILTHQSKKPEKSEILLF